jgi:hypothetical protein
MPLTKIASQISESRKYRVERFIGPHFHPVGATNRASGALKGAQDARAQTWATSYARWYNVHEDNSPEKGTCLTMAGSKPQAGVANG